LYQRVPSTKLLPTRFFCIIHHLELDTKRIEKTRCSAVAR